MFYTPYVDLNRHAAAIVARILDGARPNDIPVEQPTRIKLMINAGTAKALGASFPESIRLQAEPVTF